MSPEDLILAKYGMTKTDVADAIALEPEQRSPAERAILEELTAAWAGIVPEPPLIAALVRVYDVWLRLRGYEPTDAEELMCVIAAPPPSERTAAAAADLEWLQAFIDLWEQSRDITDAIEAEASK